MTAGLTQVETKMVKFLNTWEENHEHGPNFEELKQAGFGSKSMVHRIINQLKAKNAIEYIPYKARSVKIKKSQTKEEVLLEVLSVISHRRDCMKATGLIQQMLMKETLKKDLKVC
jgi:SOS-response transcriptional repressor LexA